MKVELLTPTNSTNHANDYGSVVESFLKNKKKNNYDIIFYDNIYTTKFGSYLLNLKDYLNETHIKFYDSRVINQTCTYKDRLVGLVI